MLHKTAGCCSSNAIPRVGKHRWSSLPLQYDPWVVPFAGQNPPTHVGDALCRVEPSSTCGWFPMLGRILRCLWVAPCVKWNPPLPATKYGVCCQGGTSKMSTPPPLL